MKKIANPILSLAVVMALALAAVFGAMSLTDTAQAAVDQWADAELTERTNSPQGVTGMTAMGGDETVTLEWNNHTYDEDGDAATPEIVLPLTEWEVRYKTSEENYSQTWAPSGDTITIVLGADDEDPTTPEVGKVRATITGITNNQVLNFQIRLIIGGATSRTAPGAPATFEAVRTADTPERTDDLTAEAGDRRVTLMWDDPDESTITGWQYTVADSEPADLTIVADSEEWVDVKDSDAETTMVLVEKLKGKTDYWFAVRALAHDTPSLPATIERSTTNVYVAVETLGIGDGEEGEHKTITVTPADTDPGKNTGYRLTFESGKSMLSGSDGIVIKMEDFGIPSSIDARTIVMRITDGPSYANCSGSESEQGLDDTETDDVDESDDDDCTTGEGAKVHRLADQSANPEGVTVSGDEITLVIPDFGDKEDGDQGIQLGDMVQINFGQAAGISNPTEGGKTSPGKPYPWEIGDDMSETSVTVPILIDIDVDDNEAGRGDTVTVTGKGYKNGGTLTFWIDNNGNGIKDLNEIELCSADVGSSDTASCDFQVTKPPFFPGTMMPRQGQNEGSCTAGNVAYCNLINAEDGRGNTATMVRNDDDIANDQDEIDDYTIMLVPSLSASPDRANPGDKVLLQLRDFKPGTIESANLAGVNVAISGTIPASGDFNISVTVPNNVPEGRQSLQVNTSAEDSERVTLEVGGPNVRATPSEVVPNQRITLVGNGFSRNAVALSSITIGGEPISDRRVNDGKGVDSVTVDSGGNWSTSLDLPLTSATTVDGDREIVIRDDQGRQGTTSVSFARRVITISPERGRVGTIAAIVGTGFPGQNDEGSSFNITVVYDADGREVTTSAQTDASGTFETQIRIPTFAGIPSTNTIAVSFRDDNGLQITTPVVHDVPESTITLEPNSGGPGTVVTVKGEGFKSFVGVTSVLVGAIEVTPAPKPSTSAQGMFEFQIAIPGVETGTQSVKVDVGQITTSQPFRVTESGINPGDITLIAAAVEPLGENLVSVWHFNNDTKTWDWYDPTLMEGNSLTHMITGETYLIRVKSTQEVILNRDTRNLTCVGGNCWNQIVW